MLASRSGERIVRGRAPYPTAEAPIGASSWSPDGNLILCGRSGGGGLFALSLTGERKLFQVAQLPVRASDGQFSPDGHWIAYASVDSQRSEVFVAPFPGAGGRVQVSTAGGGQPRWRSDGKEIFFITPDGQLMAAEVTIKGGSLEAGRVQPLFGGVPSRFATFGYDVALDGQHLL